MTKERLCSHCIKYKTMRCPNSSECFETVDRPAFQDKRDIIKPFLDKEIHICENCGKIDIDTYARYTLNGKKYVLDSVFTKCQRCGYTKEVQYDIK